MRVVRPYRDWSLKSKIIAFTYAVVLLSAAGSAYFTYRISENYVIAKVRAANAGTVAQLSASLEMMQKNIFSVSSLICVSPSIQETLNGLDRASDASRRLTADSESFITRLIVSNDYINCLLLYGRSQRPVYYQFMDASSEPANLGSIEGTAEFASSARMSGGPRWFALEEGRKDFFLNNQGRKIAMCRIIRNLDGSESPLGFLLIGISEPMIRSLYALNLRGGLESIAILDSAGQTLSASGPDVAVLVRHAVAGEGSAAVVFFRTSKEDGDLLVVRDRVKGTGWNILFSAPMLAVRNEVKSYLLATLFIALGFILVFLPVSIIFSSNLTAPVNSLIRSMRNFEKGDFSQKVDLRFNDEIGQLAAGYNSMVGNIRALVEEVYVLQIKEREAEFNMLQAQINPHFLYNTLDSIFWKARRDGESDVSRMVYALSRIFRLSLNRGGGMTEVANEKELIEQYLLLSEMRYRDRLSSRIDIDDAVLVNRIPKLMLQPFVENAVVHGLDSPASRVTVVIEGSVAGELLEFSIADDGPGIDAGRLGTIMSDNEPAESAGFAIMNVRQRLRILYKDDFYFGIESAPGSGTRVLIRVPKGTS